MMKKMTENKIEELKKLQEIQDKNKDLTIRQLPTRYFFGFPQESEKQIQTLRDT